MGDSKEGEIYRSLLRISQKSVKTFPPLLNNLKILKKYPKVLDDSYWDSWERNKCREDKGSFIKLRKAAD